jgi:hypothetical protein
MSRFRLHAKLLGCLHEEKKRSELEQPTEQPQPTPSEEP